MQRTLLNTALAIALAGFSLAASAQFSGAYAPGNWTVTNSPGDGGSVAVSAPLSIELTGSNVATDINDAFDSYVSYTITAPMAGTFSFDWQYSTADIGDLPDHPPAEFDWAGYVINGNFLLLSSQVGNNYQSGHLSVYVPIGESFGFYVQTQDNLGGAATLTVSNFTAPVPEPASMLLMAAGLAGLTLMRKRRAD